MMNNHIAIFFADTENVGSAIAAEWVDGWCIVKSAWLTAPPSFDLLQLHPKQQNQIQPQDAHEMPIARSGVQSAPSQHGVVQFPNRTDQTTEPAEYMQRVSYRQHIKKGIAHIGGKSEPLGLQLHPGKSLSGNEQQPQEKRDVEPACRALGLLMQAAHKGCNPATRNFECEAAGDNHQTIQVKDGR